MHEVLVKIGNEHKVGVEKTDDLHSVEGDIILITHPDDVKRTWDGLLSRGQVTQAEYDNTKHPDGTHKKRWGSRDLKDCVVFLYTGTLTRDQVNGFNHHDTEDTGEFYPSGRPVLKLAVKHPFKIDLDAITKFDSGQGKRVKYDAATLTSWRDKSVTVQPLYGDDVLLTELLQKGV